MDFAEKIEKQEFDSPTRYGHNGLNIKPFRFLDNSGQYNGQQLLGKYTHWTTPKIQKGKRRWLIRFSFRIPRDLKHLYPNKNWKQFEVLEDINRFKSDEYAQVLRDAVERALQDGYNPFEYRKKMFIEAKAATVDNSKRKWSCVQAFNLFRTEWEQRGLESATLTKLNRAITFLSEWLRKHNYLHDPVTNITRKWVQLALQEESQKEKWSNRTFNNNITALSTVFKFLLKEKIIPENPTIDITRKRAKAQKHRYYDPEQFKKVRTVMQKQDPLLFFAASLVYYLCIRSEKELKYLKVGNIFPDRRQVFIQADDSKTDADRFINIPDELMEALIAIKANYPANYYVVGKGARMKYVLENTPSPKPFPANMLSARFMKIRKVAGLSSNHTLYSFKHTRIIHLKQDGATDADIMQLTGHESYQAFSDYLRDLGVSGDPKSVNEKTRKF